MRQTMTMAQRRVKDDENNPPANSLTSQIKILKRNEYECSKCKWIFNRYFNATRHYERFHLPNKSIICKICGDVFLLKWEYHMHRTRIHKIIKTYGRYVSSQRKNAACLETSTEKYQLALKHRILDKWQMKDIENTVTQPIENVINPLRAGKKYHVLSRWNEEKHQNALQPIENIYDIDNNVKNLELSTSRNVSNIFICSQLENTQRLYKYKVTSEKNLMKILRSKINF